MRPPEAGNAQLAALLATWDELEPSARQLLQLLSVFYEPVSLDSACECARALSTEDPSSTWSLPEDRAGMDELSQRLRTSGLLVQSGAGLSCAAPLAEVAARAAAEEGRLGAIADHMPFELTRPRPLSAGPAPYTERLQRAIRDARLAFYGGRWSDVPRLFNHLLELGSARSGHDHPLWQIFHEPLDLAWIERAPGFLRDRIIGNLIRLATSSYDVARDLVARSEEILVGRGDPEAAVLRYITLQRLLLEGELERAQKMLGRRKDSLGLCTMRSALAFLKGDDRKAVSLYRDAFLTFKGSEVDRIHTDLPGHLYVLAVLRSGDESGISHLRGLLASTDRMMSPELRLLQNAVRCREGESLGSMPRAAEMTHAVSPFDLLLATLVDFWSGQPWDLQARSWLESIHQLSLNADLHLLAGEYAEIMARLQGEPSWLARAAQARAVVGGPSLVDVVQAPEPWEHALSALEGLAASGEQEPERTERLAWLVDTLAGGRLEFTPCVQKSHGSDRWMRHRDVKPDTVGRWMTARDPVLLDLDYPLLAIWSTISQESEWLEERLLPLLARHPHVFWSDRPDVPLEIVQAPPALRIEHRHGRLLLRVDPEPGQETRRFQAVRDGLVLRLVEYRPEDGHLFASLQGGLSVPLRGQSRLTSIVARFAGRLGVQSDVDLGDVEQVAADGTLHVRLLARGDGFTVEIRVLPLVGEGVAFPPGRGAASVMRQDHCQVVRDLVAEERSLAELQDACPTLAAAICDRETMRWTLHGTADCLSFLAEIESVPGIVLEWPEGQRCSLRRGSFAAHVRQDGDWFALDATFVLDDGLVLTLRQFLDMVERSRGRFIPLGEGAFLALTDELRRRLDDLAEFTESRGSELVFRPMASSAVEECLQALGSVDGDPAWQERVASLCSCADLAVPHTLEADLRDYQLEGFRWLARLAGAGFGACLADDMGLGKTVQALALLLHRAPGGPALVVAPTSVCSNWLEEARRFAPALQVRLYAGADRQGRLDDVGAFDVVVTTYTLLQQDAETLAALRWHSVVLDEAQAIKNFQTMRSKAAMALSADFRLITTGTPIENHLLELWNLFHFINPGLLGVRTRFVERYQVPIEREGDRVVRTRLRRLVRPFILRRTKGQVLEELPPRTDIVLHVEMGDQERALYETLRQRALESLEGADVDSGEGRIRILAELTRLRRACCHPRLVAPGTDIPSSRLETLVEVLDELRDNQHRALVFSQFVDHLSIVREHLDAQEVPYQYLDGSTSLPERARRVAAFQAGEGDLFLISLKAGGTGLNLTGADYVIHLDPWWNPAVEDQASDRAHRIGQLRPVTVYRLVARGTVEERIVALHRRKRDLADSLLDGTDAAARLSGQDLLRLLREEMSAD